MTENSTNKGGTDAESESGLVALRTPGWAKAAATSAIIVGLVGALLAILTITGVFGGHLTAPADAS